MNIEKGHNSVIVWKGAVGGAPCEQACPAGVDVPRYLRLINEGRFSEASAVIREKIPFPLICGYICFHPCEAKCRRAEVDKPVAINALKRFVVEIAQENIVEETLASRSNKSVAVVGSGPAGLTAAYYLAKLGHRVVVVEALPEPGGMMLVGIPNYRLPKDILRAEIKRIEDIGVEIRTNTFVDSLDELFRQGYDALFLATGAHQGVRIGIKGENSPRVRECLSLLRDVSLGKEVEVGERVAVIGGGNSAVDSARTALRLGAKKVTVVYRRSRTEMPANAEDVDEAIAEGVEILFLAAPSRILSQNGRLELECVSMRLEAADADGRPAAHPIEGNKFVRYFDTIISAIGQRPEIPDRFNMSLGQRNTIEVDPDTLATNRGGVFAGGDVVSGPSSVIEAIAMGRKAASSIDKYLGGSGVMKETLAPIVLPSSNSWEEGILDIRRLPMPLLDATRCVNTFDVVELGFTEEMALTEAKRCLKCDQRMQVRVRFDQCRSCSCCQLRCSLAYLGVFNPLKARIVVEQNKIAYTDNCIGGCSLCIDYCPYGILERLG